MDSYRKCKQIRHSEPKWPHAFHGCQVPGTNTQLTTAASQMHLCLPLWLSWNPIKIHERQLKPLIVVGTPGKSWNMWYSQRTLAEYSSFFHWTPILGTWWPSYVLKGIAKCHWCHPGALHQMCTPKAKGMVRDKKKVQQLSVSFGEFSLVLHIDSAEKTSWNCWNCRNANVQGFCPHSVRKEVSREQQPSEPTMQRWFLPSCCQLSLVTWELSFIHQCLAPQDFKHTVISSLIGEPSRTCNLRQATSLGQGTVVLFHLGKVKVIEVAGIWCWCILSG